MSLCHQRDESREPQHIVRVAKGTSATSPSSTVNTRRSASKTSMPAGKESMPQVRKQHCKGEEATVQRHGAVLRRGHDMGAGMWLWLLWRINYYCSKSTMRGSSRPSRTEFGRHLQHTRWSYRERSKPRTGLMMLRHPRGCDRAVFKRHNRLLKALGESDFNMEQTC